MSNVAGLPKQPLDFKYCLCQLDTLFSRSIERGETYFAHRAGPSMSIITLKASLRRTTNCARCTTNARKTDRRVQSVEDEESLAQFSTNEVYA